MTAGLGLFDTDLLSELACKAGFTLACCRDLFVHHFGSRTFRIGRPLLNPVRPKLPYVTRQDGRAQP